MRPSSGSMVWWRFKSQVPCPWKFGYVTYIPGTSDMVRMGHWNGNSTNGPVVSCSEIEWRDYHR